MIPTVGLLEGGLGLFDWFAVRMANMLADRKGGREGGREGERGGEDSLWAAMFGREGRRSRHGKSCDDGKGLGGERRSRQAQLTVAGASWPLGSLREGSRFRQRSCCPCRKREEGKWKEDWTGEGGEEGGGRLGEGATWGRRTGQGRSRRRGWKAQK